MRREREADVMIRTRVFQEPPCALQPDFVRRRRRGGFQISPAGKATFSCKRELHVTTRDRGREIPLLIRYHAAVALRGRGRPRHPDLLTPAEWSIVDAVRHGISDRGIAKLRRISRDAVKFHLANAKAKVGVRTRAELRQWRGIPANSPLASKEHGEMSHLTLGSIGQIARAVTDLSEAERFYRDVLGLPHLFTAGKLAFFDCGGVRLMIEDRSIVEVPDLHNDSVLYFRVQDIHAAQEELERRGVTFTGAPHMIYKHPDGLEEWLTFFHEPGGGLLSLIAQVK